APAGLRDHAARANTGTVRQQPPGPTLHKADGQGMLPRRVLKYCAFAILFAALPAPVALAAPETPAPAQPGVSFVKDILPVLSKAGCNAGSCHAKPEGQNGFKLSVFAYDPKSDYRAIVKGDRGRRIFPAAPS